MSERTDNFINEIMLAIMNVAKERVDNGLPICAVSIPCAQGAQETGWGRFLIKPYNYVGMRAYDSDPSANATEYTCAEDCFRDYFNVIVNEGYYDNMINNFNIEDAIMNGLASYATDPNYRTSILSIVNQYGLTRFDDEIQAYIGSKSEPTIEISQEVVESTQEVPHSSIEEVANAVIRGDFGNGEERRINLELEGYDYNEVQERVNSILNQPIEEVIPEINIDEIANQAIRGEFGNGQERKDRLEKLGYDYDTIQSRVNELLQ